MSQTYDVIVVGAGVGGLTVASLAAKEGLKTLLVEQCDRVGGRALTIRGEEILANGASWYRSLLAKQYTWIPCAHPSLEEIISGQLLKGYTLDVGYHGVALNGDGYFLDLDEKLGTGVPMVGNLNSTYIGDEWYMDFHAGKMDERLQQLTEAERIPFVKFYLAALKLKDEDFDRLESVSVTQWCKDTRPSSPPSMTPTTSPSATSSATWGRSSIPASRPAGRSGLRVSPPAASCAGVRPWPTVSRNWAGPWR